MGIFFYPVRIQVILSLVIACLALVSFQSSFAATLDYDVPGVDPQILDFRDILVTKGLSESSIFLSGPVSVTVTTIGTLDHTSKGLAFVPGLDGDTLYSISKDDSILRIIDPSDGATLSEITLSYDDGAGGTLSVNGGNGLTWDSVNEKLWAIVKIGSDRYLAIIDPLVDGSVLPNISFVGIFDDKFAGLASHPDGTLYGVTGDGATIPETLFILDTSPDPVALPTDAPPVGISEFSFLGNGDDGEAIAWHPSNSDLYHASGSGDLIFELVHDDPLVVTPIDISDTPLIGNEPTALAYWSADDALYWTNLSSNLYRIVATPDFSSGTPVTITIKDHNANVDLTFAEQITATINSVLTLLTETGPNTGNFNVIQPAPFDGSYDETQPALPRARVDLSLDTDGTVTLTDIIIPADGLGCIGFDPIVHPLEIMVGEGATITSINSVTISYADGLLDGADPALLRMYYKPDGGVWNLVTELFNEDLNPDAHDFAGQTVSTNVDIAAIAEFFDSLGGGQYVLGFPSGCGGGGGGGVGKAGFVVNFIGGVKPLLGIGGGGGGNSAPSFGQSSFAIISGGEEGFGGILNDNDAKTLEQTKTFKVGERHL